MTAGSVTGMTPAERHERHAVVAEARSWIGTPYHHEAHVKGAGVDCAQFIYRVFRNCGLIPEVEIPHYPPDWQLHRGAERFLSLVLPHAHAVASPLPGDVVIYRYGRCFAHGGIVVLPGWPTVVHAYKDAGRVLQSEGDGGELGARERRFFSHWPGAS